MPCPFPGMDPYIEREAIWGDFQWSLAVGISHALQPLVKPRHVAMIKRLPFGNDDGRFQIEILIVNPANINRIVTAIEVLCPENKRSGDGRSAYLDKRDRYLASVANVVEIDLLRDGERTLPIGPQTRGSLPELRS